MRLVLCWTDGDQLADNGQWAQPARPLVLKSGWEWPDMQARLAARARLHLGCSAEKPPTLQYRSLHCHSPFARASGQSNSKRCRYRQETLHDGGVSCQRPRSAAKQWQAAATVAKRRDSISCGVAAEVSMPKHTTPLQQACNGSVAAGQSLLLIRAGIDPHDLGHVEASRHKRRCYHGTDHRMLRDQPSVKFPRGLCACTRTR